MKHHPALAVVPEQTRGFFTCRYSSGTESAPNDVIDGMMSRLATRCTAAGKAVDARTINLDPARTGMSQAQIGAKSETDANSQSFIVEAKVT